MMDIIDIIRLVRKHFVILIITPVLMAGLVIFMTRKPNFTYLSDTILYTGIASGSSVEMDKAVNYFATNTAFDNLINVLKARETQQEVAVRLLTQHLLLEKYDPKYISAKSYNELQQITPAYIKELVAKTARQSKSNVNRKWVTNELNDGADSSLIKKSFSFSTLDSANSLPESIDPIVYEQTFKILTALMESSDTNFVFELLNFPNPHYSYKDLSTVKVQRIGSSDLVQLKYECDDPGICRQTLLLLTDACIKNYKNIKENRSDAVVRYFESQLKEASERLKVAEDKLLEFNKSNNIINYYEQSKAVAVVKEDLDVNFYNKRINLSGVEAAIKRLEEKLGNQEQIQLKNESIIEKRNQLQKLNYKIISTETFGLSNKSDTSNLAELKSQVDILKNDIKNAINDLYSYGHSVDGLPISALLNQWIANVIEAENLKAGLEVLGERIKEFQKQYEIYAPAGANIKRIEREISVSEQEFLEILHGLNLAKLKLQDNELSSNIKAIDPPYFPLTPIPTKRKILVIIAAIMGFMIVLTTVFVLEYFDSTLRNPKKTEKIIKLPNLGVIPKILLTHGKVNFPVITTRLVELIIQKTELYFKNSKTEVSTKSLLFFSTLNQEGKSVIISNLARKLNKDGSKVLVLNYQHDMSSNNSGKQNLPTVSNLVSKNPKTKIPFLTLLLGYPDTRIDYNSQFLEKLIYESGNEEYLNYSFNDKFNKVKNYTEILKQNNFQISYVPDYVLIELPSILFYSYPVDLVKSVELPLLICRSNRIWTEADQGVLDTFEQLTGQKTHFILNGVELAVIESVLGDLPKKRSVIRKFVKNMFRFNIYSKNQF